MTRYKIIFSFILKKLRPIHQFCQYDFQITLFLIGYQKRSDKIDKIFGEKSFRGAHGQNHSAYFIPGDEEQSIHQLYNNAGGHDEHQSITFHEKG